ncbi:hypothetical protein BD410DRAFT_719748 [Rickenella mellea]|uniref:ARF GTPase-activating protein GIT1 C-terminal domain-containing protein n=1 Tax=Rickenella mellea TaxID=50990 RepID=A0A4Y7Q9P8_9AGAM|nr:hypothetical protein BD410DRAFT_719748 [Rickenella mellea]
MWSSLHVVQEYLESQSKSIVHAIQIVISAISGVRTRTLKPTPMLNENLTQIVAIVSSIVAVCKDSLGSAQQGRDVLRELSDHAHQLSKLRDEAVLTRESRKVMARSSFAIANAMKKLMTLQCFAY